MVLTHICADIEYWCYMYYMLSILICRGWPTLWSWYITFTYMPAVSLTGVTNIGTIKNGYVMITQIKQIYWWQGQDFEVELI